MKTKDIELLDLLEREERRQHEGLEMIASESLQSEDVRAFLSSAFCNKTAVGLPHKQRLGGSENAAALEALAAKRACQIFGADHANMLPYSGSMANFCAYGAVLSLGDRVLALAPSAGAHQSHGGAANVTSRLFDFDYFGLRRDTMLIDYEEAERKLQGGQFKLMVVGSAAYPRDIDFERLGAIAHQNGALLMVDIAHFSGLVAAGVSPNPVPFADIVTASATKTMCGPHTGFVMCKEHLREALDRSVYPGTVASLHLHTIAATAHALWRTQGEEFRALMRRVVDNARYFCAALQKRGFGILTGGTDCHMFLADLRPLGIDGERAAALLEEIGITVNSKAIPYDENPSPSGLRAGLTVLTQRGMGEKELDEIADIWQRVLTHPTDPALRAAAADQVRTLAAKENEK